MMSDVLDACCGPRGMWCDKGDPRIIGQDVRDCVVCWHEGTGEREVRISPDVVADFRAMPYPDAHFALVMFDPPHLVRAGGNGRLALRYGRLDRRTWLHDLEQGFRECWRVLRRGGVLVFKWSTEQLPLDVVRRVFPHSPVFDSRQGKTHHLIFCKP